MQVRTLPVGPYRTNCYIFHTAHEAWIIDPGYEGNRIAQVINSLHLEPKSILLTHSHWDHLLGIPELFDHFGELPVMIHPDEAMFLGSEGSRLLRNLAISLDPSQRQVPPSWWDRIPEPTHLFKDGEVLSGCDLSVIHTPGHSPGSVSLYHEADSILFSGDTLFAQAIGRTDLMNSLPEVIIPSITERLLTLPPDTIVYPGHGPDTTIEKETKLNPWLM